jgi:hypothetical protein
VGVCLDDQRRLFLPARIVGVDHRLIVRRNQAAPWPWEAAAAIAARSGAAAIARSSRSRPGLRRRAHAPSPRPGALKELGPDRARESEVDIASAAIAELEILARRTPDELGQGGDRRARSGGGDRRSPWLVAELEHRPGAHDELGCNAHVAALRRADRAFRLRRDRGRIRWGRFGMLLGSLQFFGRLYKPFNNA